MPSIIWIDYGLFYSKVQTDLEALSCTRTALVSEELLIYDEV